MVKWIVAIAIAMVSVGCASRGTDVSDVQFHAQQVGIATCASVRESLGEPQDITQNGDLIVFMYESERRKSKVVNFIPIVSIFAGGVPIEKVITRFFFDGDCVLQGGMPPRKTEDEAKLFN